MYFGPCRDCPSVQHFSTDVHPTGFKLCDADLAPFPPQPNIKGEDRGGPSLPIRASPSPKRPACRQLTPARRGVSLCAANPALSALAGDSASAQSGDHALRSSSAGAATSGANAETPAAAQTGGGDKRPQDPCSAAGGQSRGAED